MMSTWLNRQLFLFGLASALLGFWTSAQAQTLRPGDAMPSLSLDDQHGKTHAVPGAARWMLFAADKAAADLAQGWLAAQGPGVLAARGIVYVADISAMPSVITRMFALPKLRELPFAVALVRDARQAANWPRVAAHVAVIGLDQGRITELRHAPDAAALQAILTVAQ